MQSVIGRDFRHLRHEGVGVALFSHWLKPKPNIVVCSRFRRVARDGR